MALEHYTLTLTKEQARVVESACDCYMRLLMGQLHYVADYTFRQAGMDRGCKLRDAMTPLNSLVTGFNSPHAGHGIFSPALYEDANVAHDVSSVICHRRSWDESPEGGQGVNFYDPMQAGRQPLPTIAILGPLPEFPKQETPDAR